MRPLESFTPNLRFASDSARSPNCATIARPALTSTSGSAGRPRASARSPRRRARRRPFRRRTRTRSSAGSSAAPDAARQACVRPRRRRYRSPRPPPAATTRSPGRRPPDAPATKSRCRAAPPTAYRAPSIQVSCPALGAPPKRPCRRRRVRPQRQTRRRREPRSRRSQTTTPTSTISIRIRRCDASRTAAAAQPAPFPRHHRGRRAPSTTPATAPPNQIAAIGNGASANAEATRSRRPTRLSASQPGPVAALAPAIFVDRLHRGRSWRNRATASW